MKFKIIFMGTSDFAVPALCKIHDAGHNISAVYTQPPRLSGRGLKKNPSPIQNAAEQKKLTVRSPEKIRSEDEINYLKSLNADIGIVVSFGQLIPNEILNATKYGFLNIHPSILPKWRGASPIQRTLISGDKSTAVNIIRVDEGLDTGDICLSEIINIPENITYGELSNDLSDVGANLIVKALDLISTGTADFKPQNKVGISYAKKIEKSETQISFNKNASEVHNHIRGLSPNPSAWFEYKTEKETIRIKVLSSEVVNKNGIPGELLDNELTIACKKGAVKLTRLQRPGKNPMDNISFLRGINISKGMNISEFL
jgi:methionyl-tRNA formyltransferase